MKFIQVIQLFLAIEMAKVIPSTMARIGQETSPGSYSSSNEEEEQNEGHRKLATAAPMTMSGWSSYIGGGGGPLYSNVGTSGEAMCGVSSYFDATARDRFFRFKYCKLTDPQATSATVHSTIPNPTPLEGSFLRDLPKNPPNVPETNFLTGMIGTYFQTQMDRRYDFFWAYFNFPYYVSNNCKTSRNWLGTSDWVNVYEGSFDFVADPGFVVTAVESNYDAGYHDRTFKFTTCQILKA